VEGDVVRVLEVGFGTGLNFLVTACAALGAATAWPAGAGPRLHYTALENDLPPLAALAQLDYEALLAPCSLPTRLFEHLAALGEPPPEGNHRLRFEDEHRLTLDL